MIETMIELKLTVVPNSAHTEHDSDQKTGKYSEVKYKPNIFRSEGQFKTYKKATIN